MRLPRLLTPRRSAAAASPAPRRRRRGAHPLPGSELTRPSDLAKKVRRIEIATNRLVDQGLAGDYHSAFKGRGMEFAEVRPYQPGDDVRGLDWNVTARMGAPFVKQFVEERDLTVFLAVDVSGSLGFGSRALLKRELAAELSALLAFAALRNQDRVGAALLSDRLETYLPPRRRRTHALRLVAEILEHPGDGGTDLDSALGSTLSTLSRRSVLFLISDFIATPYASAIKAAAAGHDLIVLEIVDPLDRELPAVGAPVVLRDAETGRLGLVRGRSAARDFRRRRLTEHEELHQLTRRLGVDHLELWTDRPYLGTLLSFFQQRRRRLAR